MPADNEMPGYAELIIRDCRKIRAQIVEDYGDRAGEVLASSPYLRSGAVIAGLADALDRAQRERDEARAAWQAYDGHREGCEFCAECGDAAEIADGYRAATPTAESKA